MLARAGGQIYRRLRQYPSLWALGGYLLLSLLLFAPVFPVFTTAVLGGPVARNGAWQNVWNLWWAGRALLVEHTNPFVTTAIYYPTGAPLYLQTFNVTNGLLGLWLTGLAGPIAAYNFCALVAFVLSGWGAYLLARHLTHSEGAAFVAGVLFTFSPFHLTKLSDGQMELIALQWIPFFVLFLLRAVEDRRHTDMGLAALFFVLVALTSWYYALFCAVYSGLFVALWMVADRRHFRQVLVRSLIALGLGALLLLPFLIPGLASMGAAGPPGSNADELIQLHSSDLLDFFLPSVLQPWWGSRVYAVESRWHPDVVAWNVSLGYVAIALALVGLIAAGRQTWRWGVLLFCTILLALGPVLYVSGVDTGIPMPYALLLKLPMSGIARRPSHFAVLSTLLLAILAAYGLRDLFQRLGRRWQPWLLVGALLLIGLEYVPAPLLLLQPQVHPYYATLAGREGAVLDLPPRSESSEPMQAQLVHGRPIAGGYLSRLPSYPFAQHAPAVRNLWNIQQEAPDILHEDPVSGLVALQALGFRDVVVHWDELPPEKRESMALLLRDVLGEVAPSFEDGAVSFYQIPEIPAQPFVYTYWGKGWYRLEQEGERMWRWMSGAAEIHVDNPGPQTAGVFMRFHWQSYLHPRPVNISLDSRLLTQVQVPHANSSLELLIVLPKGEHLLSFQTESDPEPAYPNRELSLTCLGVEVTYLAGALP